MTRLQFSGHRPPGIDGDVLPGRLIIVEGTDGVGRSTHIALLKEWLEDEGYAVLDTGFTRSDLAGPGIKRAKEGNTLDPITLNLFYATDFWDRFERQMIPALRAGMVVLADRYTFSLISRAAVRGVSSEWMEELYGFALIPDCVIYLDIDVDSLLPRVLSSAGFDYWESGQDFLLSSSVYENFVAYQEQLLAEFRRLAERHSFKVVDARRSIPEIFRSIQAEVRVVIAGMAVDEAVPTGAPPLSAPSAAEARAAAPHPDATPSRRVGRSRPSSSRRAPR